MLCQLNTLALPHVHLNSNNTFVSLWTNFCNPYTIYKITNSNGNLTSKWNMSLYWLLVGWLVGWLKSFLIRKALKIPATQTLTCTTDTYIRATDFHYTTHHAKKFGILKTTRIGSSEQKWIWKVVGVHVLFETRRETRTECTFAEIRLSTIFFFFCFFVKQEAERQVATVQWSQYNLDDFAKINEIRQREIPSAAIHVMMNYPAVLPRWLREQMFDNWTSKSEWIFAHACNSDRLPSEIFHYLAVNNRNGTLHLWWDWDQRTHGHHTCGDPPIAIPFSRKITNTSRVFFSPKAPECEKLFISIPANRRQNIFGFPTICRMQ